MTNIWDKTIHIDEELATKLISSQMNIKVETIEILGEGFDNIAYLINKKIVFRFPRREIALELLENEAELLPIVAKNVSFALTSPIYFGTESADFPYKFLGYPILKGNILADFTNPPIKSKEFVKQFARALKELHSIGVKPEYQARFQDTWRLDIENRTKRLTEYLENYKSTFTETGFDTYHLKDIIAKFHQIKFLPSKTSYVHGDIYAKHIIIDGKENFIGLIDWGDVHVGNPGIDIAAAIMLFDENSFTEFSNIYGKFDINAAAFRSFCHAIPVLAYAFQKQDKNLLKWSKFALARSMKLFQELFL